jgi:predicted enzyme related to lactoylglutathione lyase
MFNRVAEIIYFVSDRNKAAEWYARFFNTTIVQLEDPELFFLRVGDQEIWFHQADEQMPHGNAGQVAYWQVDNFQRTLERVTKLGAVVYLGPLDRLDGQHMCQLKDPFGNLIGIIGPQ